MIRLDQLIADRGLAKSRARARDAILRGHVTVDGMTAAKPAMQVGADATIAVADPADGYVSRSALKLATGLEHFGFDPIGRIALDLGASTGGFTQVLLRRGAALVFAVDVGHGQLDASLADDSRVISLEGVNARDLTNGLIDRPVGALVADVSFISLRLALPPALAMCERGAFAILLVKPQFEVGPEGIGKDGLVRDNAEGKAAAEHIATWLAHHGWMVEGLIASPITGGSGNREYLLGARLG